jgi:isopentenyl phosphate kinase
VTTENGRIKIFDEAILKTYLNMGFAPVLYGDATLDDKLGFTVLSGDQLVSHLARKLGARRIVIGVDIDGLYDADPKVNRNAKLFTHLSLEELGQMRNKLGKSVSTDITGGMLGKISELVPAIEQKIQVIIVNASKPNRIYKALMGEKVEGTVIERE